MLIELNKIFWEEEVKISLLLKKMERKRVKM